MVEMIKIEQMRNSDYDLTDYMNYFDWDGLKFDENEDSSSIDDSVLRIPKIERDVQYCDAYKNFNIDSRTLRRTELNMNDFQIAQLQDLLGVRKAVEEESESRTTILTMSESITESKEIASVRSYHCLKELAISDSRLRLAEIYNTFPVPQDFGLVPAFYTLYESKKNLFLPPIKSLEDIFVTEHFNLRYYCLNPKFMRVITEALKLNNLVRTIDLTGNFMTEDACYHLSDLLIENDIISSLKLSDCKIGPIGAMHLRRGLNEATELVTIDLSGCNVGDEGFVTLVEALKSIRSLKTIKVANNNLGSGATDGLRTLLETSANLEILDLQWNFLNAPIVWKYFVGAVINSNNLKCLNLAQNGIDEKCFPRLTGLFKSVVLQKLDLSGNKITEKEAISIAKKLKTNETLVELYLGNNPLGQMGIQSIIEVLASNNSPKTNFHLLNMENIWPRKNIVPLLEKIKLYKPWITIILGGIIGNYILKGPNTQKILFDRAFFLSTKKKRKKPKDFGTFIMSLEDGVIRQEKFRQILREYKLNIPNTLIDMIIETFAEPKRRIDQSKLKSYYMTEYLNSQ